MSDERLKEAARQYYLAFASGDKSLEENARANALRACFMFGERERYPRAVMATPPIESFASRPVANRRVRRRK